MSTFAYFSICRRSLTILKCQRSATTWPVQRDSLPTTRRPVGAADGHAAASALAKALAGKSNHSDFVGEHDYWWGHGTHHNPIGM